MDINYEILTHPETGFIAFISYLWGNGTIGRFISRLNQYLLFFSFIITGLVYINRNRKKSALFFLYSCGVLVVAYMFAIIYFYD